MADSQCQPSLDSDMKICSHTQIDEREIVLSANLQVHIEEINFEACCG